MIELAEGVAIPGGELCWRATRSGGPGGQHVNKASTRVELWWEPGASALPAPVRERIVRGLARRLDARGRLRIVADSHRSQARNREEALARLRDLVAESLRPRRVRRATRPPASAGARRLAAKRRRAVAKRDRRPPARD